MMKTTRLALGFSALTVLTLSSPGVWAQPAAPASDPNRSPFAVNYAVEIPFAVGIFLAAGTPRLMVDEVAEVWCGLQCDPNDVNPLDRTVIGFHSAVAASVSDADFISSMALPFAFGAIDLAWSDPADGWDGFLNDSFVLLETMSVALSINNLFNMLVRRPRPLVYDPYFSDEDRLAGDAVMSFYSGHTAISFAVATAYPRIYLHRHPDETAGTIALFLNGYALATIAGYMRVRAGQHFWTDVIAGATSGVGFGLLIPWLHEDHTGSVTVARHRLTLLPTWSTGGGGVTVNITQL